MSNFKAWRGSGMRGEEEKWRRNQCKKKFYEAQGNLVPLIILSRCEAVFANNICTDF